MSISRNSKAQLNNNNNLESFIEIKNEDQILELIELLEENLQDQQKKLAAPTDAFSKQKKDLLDIALKNIDQVKIKSVKGKASDAEMLDLFFAIIVVQGICNNASVTDQKIFEEYINNFLIIRENILKQDSLDYCHRTTTGNLYSLLTAKITFPTLNTSNVLIQDTLANRRDAKGNKIPFFNPETGTDKLGVPAAWFRTADGRIECYEFILEGAINNIKLEYSKLDEIWLSKDNINHNAPLTREDLFILEQRCPSFLKLVQYTKNLDADTKKTDMKIALDKLLRINSTANLPLDKRIRKLNKYLVKRKETLTKQLHTSDISDQEKILQQLNQLEEHFVVLNYLFQQPNMEQFISENQLTVRERLVRLRGELKKGDKTGTGTDDEAGLEVKIAVAEFASWWYSLSDDVQARIRKILPVADQFKSLDNLGKRIDYILTSEADPNRNTEDGRYCAHYQGEMLEGILENEGAQKALDKIDGANRLRRSHQELDQLKDDILEELAKTSLNINTNHNFFATLSKVPGFTLICKLILLKQINLNYADLLKLKQAENLEEAVLALLTKEQREQLQLLLDLMAKGVPQRVVNEFFATALNPDRNKEAKGLFESAAEKLTAIQEDESDDAYVARKQLIDSFSTFKELALDADLRKATKNLLLAGEHALALYLFTEKKSLLTEWPAQEIHPIFDLINEYSVTDNDAEVINKLYRLIFESNLTFARDEKGRTIFDYIKNNNILRTILYHLETMSHENAQCFFVQLLLEGNKELANDIEKKRKDVMQETSIQHPALRKVIEEDNKSLLSHFLKNYKFTDQQLKDAVYKAIILEKHQALACFLEISHEACFGNILIFILNRLIVHQNKFDMALKFVTQFNTNLRLIKETVPPGISGLPSQIDELTAYIKDNSKVASSKQLKSALRECQAIVESIVLQQQLQLKLSEAVPSNSYDIVSVLLKNKKKSLQESELNAALLSATTEHLYGSLEALIDFSNSKHVKTKIRVSFLFKAFEELLKAERFDLAKKLLHNRSDILTGSAEKDQLKQKLKEGLERKEAENDNNKKSSKLLSIFNRSKNSPDEEIDKINLFPFPDMQS